MVGDFTPARLHFYIRFVLESISFLNGIRRICINFCCSALIETERNKKQNQNNIFREVIKGKHCLFMRATHYNNRQ